MQRQASTIFCGTDIDSTTFAVGGRLVMVNILIVMVKDYVAYMFADIEGYSKFGNYTGNGNADGRLSILDFALLGLWLKIRSSK